MLYGKWRPQGFEEVVGQDHIVTTLRNALATGQVAHAYLFCGPRGTGKTTTARILARAVNCLNPRGGDPCLECTACVAIGKGAALDLIEMDAASNRGIEDVRQLRDKIAFAPTDLKRKVYLLDEAHMLTQGAFNALLKTLEEPPPHAIFILATTESHEIPATIASRCQRYDFHRVANDAVVSRLRFIAGQEGYTVPDEGLRMVAIQSRGGLRDAITLMEQVVARYGPTPSTAEVLDALGLVHDPRSEQLARAIITGDLAASLDIARAVADDGVHVGRFTRETVDVLRDVLPQVLRKQPLPTSPHRDLAELSLKDGRSPAQIAAAIEDLAEADFRLDPASPIPLEIALATAILGPVNPPVAEAPAQAAEPGRGQPRSRTPQAAAESRPSEPAAADMTPEQRFFAELRERCRMLDIKTGAKLSEATVLSLGEGTVELGVFFPFHLQSLEKEGRPVLERAAEEILGRPVTFTFQLQERKPGEKATPKGGHLARAAEALGARPVGRNG